MEMTNRTSFSPISPYREKRPVSSKLIFIVCEGEVTEYNYFKNVVSKEFDNLKSKVQVINILEDSLKKPRGERTAEEKQMLSCSNPKNLLEKMNDFVSENEHKYDFSKHNDEFWLIMDVDDHTSANKIKEWNNVLNQCDMVKYKYNYAVSNPFFELWLLLHHDDINDEDFKWAVTENHSYEPTTHFKTRLRELGKPLKGKNKKCIDPNDYKKDDIIKAVERAEILDANKERYPTNLGSTVYKLMQLLLDYDNNSE